MKRMLLAVAAAGLAALAVVGCGGKVNGSTSLEIAGDSVTQDGVNVTMTSATAAPDELGWDYSFDVTIENASDVGVMQVVYGISIRDADGEEIRSFGHVHAGRWPGAGGRAALQRQDRR